MTIKEILEIIMQLAEEKGFGTKPDDISVPEKIALIHAETSECFEAYRHQNLDGEHGFKEEMADIIIRTLHLAGVFDVDIEKEIMKKMEKNQKRNWDWKKLNEKNSAQ